jgi:hypothetical protein
MAILDPSAARELSVDKPIERKTAAQKNNNDKNTVLFIQPS